jgi:hypothetical protein
MRGGIYIMHELQRQERSTVDRASPSPPIPLLPASPQSSSLASSYGFQLLSPFSTNGLENMEQQL